MDRKLQGNKIKVTSLDGYKGKIPLQTTRTLAEDNTLPSWPLTNCNQIKFGTNAKVIDSMQKGLILHV